MCKPSCCPGSNTHGLGIVAGAAVILITAALIAEVAKPVIHTAETVLKVGVEVAAITFGILATAALITAVALVVIRIRWRSDRPGPAATRDRPQAVNGLLGYVITDNAPLRAEISGQPQLTGNLAGRGTLPQLCPVCKSVTNTARPATTRGGRRHA